MRHSARARFLPTLVCAGCLLALPGAARAGGSPVHIDPASPVAKEYALPLATARGAPPESGESGKLFGSGLKHSSAATSHTTAPSHTTATSSATTPPPSTTTAATVSPETAAAPSAPPETTPPSEPPSSAAITSTTPAQTQTRPRRRHRPEHVTTVTLPSLTRPITPARTRPVTGQATPAAYRVLRPGSGSGLLWMALAAVVVVALGSAGGIALSRRR